jgi:hypothetical protein
LNATIAAPRAGTSAVADLMLVRYALATPTPKKVRDDVGKLVSGESLGDAEFKETLDELVVAGRLSKGPRSVFSLTDEGRQRALQFLGLSELPPDLNWSLLLSKYLFPKAVGLSAEAATNLKGERLSAIVLRQKYGLASAAVATVNQALEAIACKELGYPEETTLAGLLETVLSRLMESDRRLTKDELAKQAPLFKTGLKRVHAFDIRYKLVRDWLNNLPASEPGPDTQAPASEASPPEPFDLTAFASTVRALASSSPPEDRFHDNKVFIAPLWRASQHESNFPPLALAEFKQRLIEANARHLIHLSRADLLQAMDPVLVAESETVHLNATFHFVLLEET